MHIARIKFFLLKNIAMILYFLIHMQFHDAKNRFQIWHQSVFNSKSCLWNLKQGL